MGGSMPSSPQGNGAQLAQMFGQNQATHPNQIAPIQAPGFGPPQAQPARPPLNPTLPQVAAQTQARMLARTPPPPMAAPATAPMVQQQQDWANRERRGGSR